MGVRLSTSKGGVKTEVTEVRPRPLIVGIDPGTTTGIAIMDLDGELVLLESGRSFSMPAISSSILDRGEPVIIASDKHPAPRSVEKLASAFSSVLVFPNENVSRLEKAKMARRFEQKNGLLFRWRNQHERDALVAVLLAWKRVAGLMSRVDTKLKKYSMRDDFGEMKGFVKSGVILQKRNIQYLLKKFLQSR